MENESSTPTQSSAPDTSKTTLFVVIAGVVLVLLAVGMFVWRMNAENSNPPAPVAQTAPTVTPTPTVAQVAPKVASIAATITFNGKSYSPTVVNIKKGEAVKFVNSSTTVTMAVASAPHPTHTDYPEFDQDKDPVQNGKSEYVFTFNKVGSWKFHNHTPFTPGGTVVVKE